MTGVAGGQPLTVREVLAVIKWLPASLPLPAATAAGLQGLIPTKG